jgi:hypothetical protein
MKSLLLRDGAWQNLPVSSVDCLSCRRLMQPIQAEFDRSSGARSTRVSLRFNGFNFRNPEFDGPGDRRVLATVIPELQRMITPDLELQAAIRAYRDYRCRDAHERRIIGDLEQLVLHRVNQAGQISYRGWLWHEHKIDARSDFETYVRSQRDWLDAIAQEFKP